MFIKLLIRLILETFWNLLSRLALPFAKVHMHVDLGWSSLHLIGEQNEWSPFFDFNPILQSENQISQISPIDSSPPFWLFECLRLVPWCVHLDSRVNLLQSTLPSAPLKNISMIRLCHKSKMNSGEFGSHLPLSNASMRMAAKSQSLAIMIDWIVCAFQFFSTTRHKSTTRSSCSIK